MRLSKAALVTATLTFGVLSGSMVRAADPAGSLVGQWRFDEGSGTTAYDSSGRSPDGTINGATWVEGLSGKALRFDGVDDYVEIPDVPQLNGVTEATFCYWVKYEGEPKVGRYCLCGYIKDAAGAAIRLGMASWAGVFFNPGSHSDVNIPYMFSSGIWYHLALTIQVGVQWQVFVNGDLIASGTQGLPASSIATGRKWGIGASMEPFLPSPMHPVPGVIDEVHVYNQALTPEEIETLYLALAPVHFPDTNLEAAVRQAVGKPQGDICHSDLGNLSVLEAVGKGIVNLSGLEHCTGLRRLDLRHNQIADLAPLGGLANLEQLSMDFNQIGDVTPLAGLTNLTGLFLGVNQIAEVGPLAGLLKLTDLSLIYNQVANLTPLAHLTNLRSLDLDANQISNITPLGGLANLTGLFLGVNQITDITALAGLANLDRLWLHRNRIVEIGPLASLTKLVLLDLTDNQISGLTPLAGLMDLRELYLEGNRISDLTPLAGLKNLGTLNLKGNEVADIWPLVTNLGLSAGDELDLGGNPLSEISVSTYLGQLQARGVVVVTSLPPVAAMLLLGLLLRGGRGLFLMPRQAFAGRNPGAEPRP